MYTSDPFVTVAGLRSARQLLRSRIAKDRGLNRRFRIASNAYRLEVKLDTRWVVHSRGLQKAMDTLRLVEDAVRDGSDVPDYRLTICVPGKSEV